MRWRHGPGKVTRLPDRPSGMTASACTIAVSEMTGFPLEELCGFVVVILTHPAGHSGAHALGIMPGGSDLAFARRLLQQAAADIEVSADP